MVNLNFWKLFLRDRQATQGDPLFDSTAKKLPDSLGFFFGRCHYESILSMLISERMREIAFGSVNGDDVTFNRVYCLSVSRCRVTLRRVIPERRELICHRDSFEEISTKTCGEVRFVSII